MYEKKAVKVEIERTMNRDSEMNIKTLKEVQLKIERWPLARTIPHSIHSSSSSTQIACSCTLDG